MTNNEWIELFFSEAYEKQINELMLEDRDYVIPYDTIYNYVKQIIDIPYTEFLDFVKVYGNISYDKRDVPQFIDYKHCEDSMIRLLIEEDNTGFTPLEIGQLLCEPGWSSRYYVYYANRHLLSAKILGIVFEYFGHWYLNCIGYVYLNLEPSQQKSLFARTLLRSPFFKSIIAGNPKRISLLDLVYVIPYSFIKNHYIAITSFVSICITEAYNWGRKIDFDDHLFGRVNFKDILNFKALKKKSSSLSYSMYLNEVMSYYDIEEKEALQLYYRYKNGDRHAFDEIVKTAQSIVIKIASSYKFAPIEDIIQEGNLGLLEGIESFDQQKNYSFLGYLSFFVKRRIQSCQYEISSLIRLPLNEWQSLEIMKKSFDRYVQKNNLVPSVNDLDIGEVVDQKKLQSRYDLLAVLPDMICIVDDLDCFESNLPPTDDFQENEYNKYIVNNLLRYLGKRDNQLVKAYFGLEHGRVGETYGEIGERFGLTRERVRQIVFKSAKIMREQAALEGKEADIGDTIKLDFTEQVGRVHDKKKTKDGNTLLIVIMEAGNTEEVSSKAPIYEVLSRTINNKPQNRIPTTDVPAKKKEPSILPKVTSVPSTQYEDTNIGWAKKAKECDSPNLALNVENHEEDNKEELETSVTENCDTVDVKNTSVVDEQRVDDTNNTLEERIEIGDESNTDIEYGKKDPQALPVENQVSEFAAEKELSPNLVVDEQGVEDTNDILEERIEIGDEVRTPSYRCGKVIAMWNMKDGLSKLMLQTKDGTIFSFVTSSSNVKYVIKRNGEPFDWRKKTKEHLENERSETHLSNDEPYQEQPFSSSNESNTGIESSKTEPRFLPAREIIDEQRPFSVGDKVEHNIWGRGVIKEIVLGGSLIGVSFNGSTIEYVKPSAIRLRKKEVVATSTNNDSNKVAISSSPPSLHISKEALLTKMDKYQKLCDESFQLYAERIINLKQAKIRGEVIVAKPVLLLALIDGVDEAIFENNRFYFNEWLAVRYLSLMNRYAKDSQFESPTIINNPFWHLTTDGFWHLQLKEEYKEKATPSIAWLKKNVLFASFDVDLWMLLQNPEWRMKMRDFIIENKLTK